MKLCMTQWRLAVCKIQGNQIPQWANLSAFLNFCTTPTETSLVCEEDLVPERIDAERNWQCLIVDGILDFSLVGIISQITSTLAEKQISVFVVSTYDTDYILVKQVQIDDAVACLTKAGYTIV